MADLATLLEAEKRGILPADKVALLAEARRRGLVPTGEPPIPEPMGIGQLAPPRPGGVPMDIAMSVTEGATAGFSDEIAGLVRGLVDQGMTVEEATNLIRQRMAEIPTGTRIAGNIAGGLATPALAGLRAPATVAQAARQGAGLGAAAGAGFTEGGPIERAAGAATGAVTGGALGGAGQATIQGISRLVARMRQGATGAQARALDDIIRELRANEITPDDAIRRVQDLGPEGMLADVPELQRLAQQTASRTAAGEGIARAAVRERARGASQRLDQALNAAFEDRPLREVRNNIIQIQRQNADELYEPALTRVETLARTPELDDLIGRPVTKTVRGKPRRTIEGGSSDITGEIASLRRSRPDMRGLPDTSPRLLHEVRVRLAEKSAGQGARKRTINAINQQLTDAMDEAGATGYRDAVRQYRADSLTLEAFDAGRNSLNELPENVEAFLTRPNISDAEREAFIAGLGRQIARELATGETKLGTQGARGVLRGEKADVIREALGDEAYGQFRDRLLRELTFSETSTRTVGQSLTQPRQAAEREFAEQAGRAARMARTARAGGGIPGLATELLGRSPTPRIPVERARAQALFNQPSEAFAATNPLAELAQRQLNLQGATLAPIPQILPGAAGVGAGSGSAALLEMLGF